MGTHTLSVATTCDNLLSVTGLVPAIVGIEGVRAAEIVLGYKPESRVSAKCRNTLNITKYDYVPWSDKLLDEVQAVLRDTVLEHDRQLDQIVG